MRVFRFMESLSIALNKIIGHQTHINTKEVVKILN